MNDLETEGYNLSVLLNCSTEELALLTQECFIENAFVSNIWTDAARAARHLLSKKKHNKNNLKPSTRQRLADKGQGLDFLPKGSEIRKSVAARIKSGRRAISQQTPAVGDYY